MTPNKLTPAEIAEIRAVYTRRHEKGTRDIVPPVVPCVHRGEALTGNERDVLGLDHRKNWFHCDHPRRAELKIDEVVCPCAGCNLKCSGYTQPGPDRITHIDPTKLVPAPDGRRFNCSITSFQGRRLMAYRVGGTHCRIAVAELGTDLQPVANTVLALDAKKCAVSQEDPRLFIYDGGLHVVFTGLESVGRGLRIKVMIASLRADLSVVDVWRPQYPRETPVEKNWMPFEFDGHLFAVYKIVPHRIIRLRAGRAADHAETKWSPRWHGELRGGCPPVRMGNEFFHWFHGWRREKGVTHYSVGVYTFEAKTPFRPLRFCPHPLWMPDTKKIALNGTPGAKPRQNVVYPGGAVLDGNRWLVSAGHQDAECLVGEFSRDGIEEALQPI